MRGIMVYILEVAICRILFERYYIALMSTVEFDQLLRLANDRCFMEDDEH